MHEASIAHKLFQSIAAEAAKYDGKPVAARVSFGTLAYVNDELLLEAFAAIIKGTQIENTKLKLEHKPLRGLCEKCGKQFDIDLSKIRCTHCGSRDLSIQPDAPIVLEEIEFQKD